MKKILFLQHAYSNRGGTEQHSCVLARVMSIGYQIQVLSYEHDRIILIEHEKILKQWVIAKLPFPETPLHAEEFEKIYREVLDFFAPDLIHVHHLMNWPFSVLEIAHQRSIPCVLTLHDYYAITPEFTWSSQIDVSQTTDANYSTAVFQRDISPYLSMRRNFLTQSLTRNITVISPSQFTADVFAKVFKNPVEIIPHGVDRVGVDSVPSADLAFGYIGSFLPQKGFMTLLRAFKRYQQRGGTWTLQMFGGNLAFPVKGVEAYGVYEPADLSDISQKFVVGIVPSLFPESFCFTLSELWMMNKFVIASAIGAVPEQMERQSGKGIMFPAGDIVSLSEAMISVGQSYQEKKLREIGSTPVRTTDQMCKDYVALYERLT